jgi:hypothetical protein
VEFGHSRVGPPPIKPSNRHTILVVQIGDQTIRLLVEDVGDYDDRPGWRCLGAIGIEDRRIVQ